MEDCFSVKKQNENSFFHDDYHAFDGSVWQTDKFTITFISTNVNRQMIDSKMNI